MSYKNQYCVEKTSIQEYYCSPAIPDIIRPSKTPCIASHISRKFSVMHYFNKFWDFTVIINLCKMYFHNQKCYFILRVFLT